MVCERLEIRIAISELSSHLLVSAVNALWILLLDLFLIPSREAKSVFPGSPALNWLLFAWLAWYDFP
jgi:hypothetical protein